MDLTIDTSHSEYLWRRMMERRTEKQEREWWDRHHPLVQTREKGTIPNIIPESLPLNKDQKLMDKYNLSPNDPQWVFELCKRVKDKCT
jgi:hypothetical protein